MKVLVVDDKVPFLELLNKLLTGAGHDVVGAAVDGRDALEKYRQLKPDVVLMDLVMPGVSGLDAMKSILDIDPRARIIMVSALGSNEMVNKAMSAGARDFVAKPFLPDRIIEALDRVSAG